MKLLIALLVIFVGVLLQVFVPLHLIDVTAWEIFGIPAELSAVFIGTILAMIGIWLMYLLHFKSLAAQMDNCSCDTEDSR